MNDLIRVENIHISGLFAATSFWIQQGGMYALVTPKDEVTTTFTRLLIGLDKPLSGKISLFGSDIASLSQRILLETRCKIGVVFKTGGLISNLKVWENLTLPLYYHQYLSHTEIETQGVAMLERLGYSGGLMELPANLTVSQRKVIGAARAMLAAPEIIIYESPLYGLNQEEKTFFFTNALQFHHEKPGRVSLFITAGMETIGFLPDAAVIHLVKGHTS